MGKLIQNKAIYLSCRQEC